MQDEIKSLNSNNIWTLTDLPNDKTPIQLIWIFKIKRNKNGSVRIRLAKGFMQVQNMDYSDTYSPVIRYSTIRLLLS